MQRFAGVCEWVCIDDVNKSFLPVDFGASGSGGGGVNVIGLGDNSTEWNIIGILFTNEKVACVDTENNELNQVLSYKKIIGVYGEAYKQKSVFSTVLFEVNSIFLGAKFNCNTCSVGVNCGNTIKSECKYVFTCGLFHTSNAFDSFFAWMHDKSCGSPKSNMHVKLWALPCSNFVKSNPLESFQSITAITLNL